MNCRIIAIRRETGAANMALDDVLLEAVSEDPTSAVLRFYEWSEPTLSLGYFQPLAQAREESRFSNVPLVRRKTGGGAIWHEHEITYALILPSHHALGFKAADLYRAVHETIRDSLRSQGLDAVRRADRPSDEGVPNPNQFRTNRPFLCFTDRDPEDIVIEGSKVVGSAQRRKPRAILQHGSILLGRSATVPELPGVFDLAGKTWDIEEWVADLVIGILERLGLDQDRRTLSTDELRQALEVEREIFRDNRWTTKR